ncbi:lipoprotein N-acyltransferase Lnb domain-containing protein [Lacinutrix chionoecetis]
MKRFLLVLFLLSSFCSFSQVPQLTENTEISIITIGPGKLLNDSFGHNGFRVQNEYLDAVYDYGRYNFDDPNFYTNFAKGKLKYLMGAAYTKEIFEYYQSQDRTIKEQVLNLNQAQKQALLNYLANNYKPEKRAYLYDFFFDNCATKMRDVSENVLNNTIKYNTPEAYKAETFRQLIQNNLYWNTWGSFGIDIALGSVIDRPAEPREYMFLPEHVYVFFEKATFKDSGEQLVKASKTVYKQKGEFDKGNFFVSPVFILSILAVIIIFITYSNNNNNTRSKWLDGLIFSITGVIGILLLLLWFATDHSATANNYNLLWACPISIIALFQIFKNQPKRWLIGYLKLLIIMLSLLTLHWIIGVQVFAPALIPLLVALLIRYVFLVRFFGREDFATQTENVE